MNLNQLEYFVTVAELLNFTKAAEKCFISQTAMTQQIRALEKSVGVPLLIRDKHHVELTSAGRVYLNEARIILHRSDEAMRLARMAQEGVTGEITIGYISGYGQSDFSDILRQFRLAYPGIKVNLVRDNLSMLQEYLEQGKCDVIIAVAQRDKEDKRIISQYITSYPLMVALPTGHNLGQSDYLRYADLQHENFIMMQPKGRSKDQMEESVLIYERGGYIPNVVEVEGDQETLLLMVAAGMGISILPNYITRLYQNDKNLKFLPLVLDDESADTLDLEVSRMAKNINPAVEQFLNILNKDV